MAERKVFEGSFAKSSSSHMGSSGVPTPASAERAHPWPRSARSAPRALLHGPPAVGRGTVRQPVARGGRVVQPRVVLELGVGRQQGLLPTPGRQQGLARVVLAVGDALGQVLVPALGQQQEADDADERAAGEDDVVQEVALLVVQLDDGRRQHAEARTGQHQPQATAPAGNAQVGGGSGPQARGPSTGARPAPPTPFTSCICCPRYSVNIFLASPKLLTR